MDAAEGAQLSFWCKVSSEGFFDALVIYVNGGFYAEYDAEIDWTEEVINLNARVKIDDFLRPIDLSIVFSVEAAVYIDHEGIEETF